MDRPGDPAQIERMLHLLWSQVRDHAIILLDAEGRVVGWPRGAQNVFGCKPEQMLGRRLDAIFTPEDRARGVPQGEIEIALKLGKSEDDRWLLRADGLRMWVSGILTCLRDAEGRCVGFSKILRERTDLKEQVESLRARANAFEAEDEKKALLLGTLAHELRNPLGVLTNAVRLMEMSYPNDEKLAYATQLIERQTRYLSTLVEDLLENVRLRQGKVTLQCCRLELGEVLAAAIETTGAAMREKGQKVELVMPQSRIELDADRTRLQQVFVNLLHNAAKFSGENSAISVQAITEDGEAVVRVVDSGRGIPPDLLPKLFNLFTQGEDLVHGHGYPGVGIGLSIVKQYVELHGGTVQARSEGLGRGSEFIVRLPLPGSGPEKERTSAQDPAS